MERRAGPVHNHDAVQLYHHLFRWHPIGDAGRGRQTELRRGCFPWD